MKYLITFIMIISFLYTETIKMGYRTTERKPLIGEEGDNEGLYKELYTEALSRLGYELEIVRLPKARILKELEKGNIDFYPGFNFTLERSEYTYYIKNGLAQVDVIVTLASKGDIDKFKDLIGLTYIKALGGPKFFSDRQLKSLEVFELPELELERALKLIKLGRGDFYIYDKASLEYYIKTYEIKALKIHEGYFKDYKDMYLGFSRKSKFYLEEENENYEEAKELRPENFPFKVVENSFLEKFEEVLKELREEGYTEELYNKYYR